MLAGHSDQDDDWKVGHPMVFPYGMRVGGQWVDQMQIRVPIDDTHTWKLFYTLQHPAGGSWQHQERPAVYEFPWRRDDGPLITDYVEGQDIMAWRSQDRSWTGSLEHLGRSDAGVAMLRKMFKENMQIVADGGDPLGTVRIPHDIIELPCEKDKFGAGAAFTDQWINGG